MINTEILDPEERMKDLLFRNKDYKETSRTIRDLWVLRRQLLKELEKKKYKRRAKEVREPYNPKKPTAVWPTPE